LASYRYYSYGRRKESTVIFQSQWPL